MSMHTYARTLTPTVKRPQRIDDAIDRARMHTRIMYPPVLRHDHLRSDQTTLMINGVIQAMWEDSDRLLSMYRVTTIGRGQPQAPTHRQLVADNKSRRSNPMSECSAQRRLKATNKIGLKEKHGKTPHVNGKVHVVFMCEIDAILSPSPLRTQIRIKWHKW